MRKLTVAWIVFVGTAGILSWISILGRYLPNSGVLLIAVLVFMIVGDTANHLYAKNDWTHWIVGLGAFAASTVPVVSLLVNYPNFVRSNLPLLFHFFGLLFLLSGALYIWFTLDVSPAARGAQPEEAGVAALFCSWRERKADGQLSSTLYEGLRFTLVSGEEVLVSLLSHGLRVLTLEDENRYQWEFVGDTHIKISREFAHAAEAALEADRKFQGFTEQYKSKLAT